MIRKLCGEGPLSFYAETVGFAFWKTIRTGKAFESLSPEEAHAVIAHEEGHIVHWHIEKRILRLLIAVFRPQRFYDLCAAQEFEADDYAKARGYGPALAAFLARLPDAPQDGYPTTQERIARLLK
jgi:Zn-dependent protease with chaperone function